MRFIQKLVNERFAKSTARLMEFVCYLGIGLLALCTVFSFIGRQTFILHTHAGRYERAIYAEEDHSSHSRGMTVHISDEIHVWTNDDDQVDGTIQLGLSLMYAVHTVPIMLALWFLSRVCSNIHGGQIFTEQNAFYLLYYGLIQFSVAVFVPFLKLLICWLTNLISDGGVSIATGQHMLDTVVPSIAFIVAAYIIRYGVHLQDEVDHTL